MASIFQNNFRDANKEFIRIASDTNYSARMQGLLITKLRKEIENKFDVSRFYEKDGKITLDVQNEAIEWENKGKMKSKD